jgi:uncharacterized protein DUF3450
MDPIMNFSMQKPALLAAVICFFPFATLQAEPLTEAVKVELATNNAAIKSQQKIDSLNDKTRQMLEQYRASLHQHKSLKTYNAHLQDLLTSQVQEKESLQQQLVQIETTQQEIVPLILRMLDSLEQFILLDMPFLMEERQQRLAGLKAMMVRADISNAEKYRRILEAYQIENDYGNTIESYRAELELNGVVSTLDFLRLGRVALYFQRLDGSETGYWDRVEKKWQTLPPHFRNPIRDGLRIARKEAAPDLLTLPIPVAEVAQ